MIGDTADARVHVRAAELLGRHFFTGRGFHERRSAEENRAGAFDDHRFIRHRRHVRAARGRRSHHRRDLGDLVRRHDRLVVENAAEVLAIGKDVRLQRQKGAAGVDEIDARQIVPKRDFLRAKMFFHRHRKVRSAFDGGVVGDDEALALLHASDAGHDSGGRRFAVVHLIRRERR